MLKEELEKLLAGKDLTAEETAAAFEKIASKSVPQVQIGAFLAALRAKGESESELAGAARMLRRKCCFIDHGPREVIDTCGTGGDRRDGRSTFNISTTCAFVAAGAGVAVAKHGNRSVSSRCGSADVLAELGYNLDAEPEVIEDSIIDNGIGFLFAAKLHPVMGAVAACRRELGIRTIFNMLGPLINPANAGAQLLGVYEAKLTELFARVLRDLKLRRALVVHGHDGMDEITICAPTRVSELRTETSAPTICIRSSIWADSTVRVRSPAETRRKTRRSSAPCFRARTGAQHGPSPSSTAARPSSPPAGPRTCATACGRPKKPSIPARPWKNSKP